jgi:hypothetical protein
MSLELKRMNSLSQIWLVPVLLIDRGDVFLFEVLVEVAHHVPPDIVAVSFIHLRTESCAQERRGKGKSWSLKGLRHSRQCKAVAL